MKGFRRTHSSLLLAAALVAACAPLRDTTYPPVLPGSSYDRLYPHYVELCALSQIRAKFAEHGGSPGHAVMYLKGACRDSSSPYPRLELCDSDTAATLSNPKTGVGISVNRVLKNVNWVMVPGKKLFFHGNLTPDQMLNEDRARATIRFAAENDVFEGIEIHSEYSPAKDPDAVELFLASETLGTDFALSFGRNVYCAMLPVNRQALGDIIGYLNALNDQYAREEADYRWSGYSDNCVHTVRNALSAANVWRPKSVNQIKLRQLFNLAVPANEFANLAFRSNRFPIEDFDAVYSDAHMRRALVDYGWLPARHGALLKYIPVHQNNELYDTRHRIFVLESPLFRRKTGRIADMYRDRRFTAVKENLLYYRERYEAVLRERPANWERVSPGDDYRAARRTYYRYIEKQLEDIDDKLAMLGDD